ncbi:MAG: hypothetical protein REI93_07435, partial [Pedobacter sp.]|nr:hypothetical protein [Pedobacter sp.]
VADEIQYAPTTGTNPTPDYLNRIEVGGQLSVYGFPIDLNVVNNYNPLNKIDLGSQNLFKFDLAKDQFKQQFQQLYQADLQKYKDLKDKKFAGLNVEQHLKKGIQSKIQSYLPMQATNNPKLMSYLNNPDAIRELLKMDETQVKAKLTHVLTDLKTEIHNKGQNFYLTQKDSLTQKLKAEKDSLTQDIQSKVNEITAYVSSVKQELNSYGLDQQKLDVLEKIANHKISEQELETFMISQLSSQPQLQGAQKLYAKFKEFKAGNFGSMLPGSFMNRDLFLNGASITLKTLRGPVKAGIAVQKDIGLPKDLEFERSTFSSPKLLTYLSIPTTNFSFGSGKLSWVGQYDKQYNNTSYRQSTAIPKTNLVFTATQNVNFNKLGKLTIDISKSTVQYNNLVNGPDELMISTTTQGNYFRDDFLQTMAVGVNHAFDSKKMDVNSNLYFSYSGIGFQNPGQQGIANMNMRFGGNLKKNFFHNKLSLYVRSDVKNTPISAENNAHWQNYNVQLDSKIRLSKTTNFSLKYIENGVSKVNTGSEPVYAGQKIQADFNARYKLFGKYSFSYLAVGRQDMDNLALLNSVPVGQQTPNMGQTNFMLTNFMQSVVFKDFTFNGNFFYNKQLTSNPIMGDMLNADVSCQFMLFKSVGISSGLTYLNNENIAKQVGIRQNIQFMLKKHFDVSAYLDLRKNLITPLYADLFAKGRGEISLRYYFDKQ